MSSYPKMLLNLTLSPAKGWEDIDDDSPDSRRLLTHGYIPLLFIALLSVGATVFYHQQWTWGDLIMSGVILFGKFFISYYVAYLLMGLLLPHISAPGGSHDNRIANFCILSLSMLALIAIIENCLPEGLPLIKFLPLYVIIVMWQGRGYLSIPAHNGVKFITAAVMSVILPPLLIDIMFSSEIF